MSPPKQEDPSFPDPETPRRIPVAKNGVTPTNRRAATTPAGATPKSAPAASGNASSQKKKPEPTLLADFLLGRPSPARVAAQRSPSKPRRKSVALDAAGVREELRQEMRAAAVRRIQQPGGVHDRVKAWQKTSVSAMKAQGGGVPRAEDVASEPTEVAVQIDAESVTEEDRVRIKMRQKAKKRKEKADRIEAERASAREAAEEERIEKDRREKLAGGDGDDDESHDETSQGLRPQGLPKKRIVSDEHWMKRRKGKSPPRGAPPKPKAEGSPTPIPKDFLQRTAQNPTVKNKIKDWATRVEIPDPVPVPRTKQYHHTKSGATVTVEEDATSVGASSLGASSHSVKVEPKPPVDDGIRVKPMKPRKPKYESDDGIRVYPLRKKEPPDDGIRVRPISTGPPLDDGIRVRPVKEDLQDDGIRVRPVEASLPNDGIRVRPMDGDVADDGIRIRPGRRISVDEITVRPPSSRRNSVERTTRMPSTRRAQSPPDVIEVIEESETEIGTPTRRREPSRRRSPRGRSPTTVTQTERSSDNRHSESEESALASHHDGSDDDSYRHPPTVQGNKSLADIPVGFSAFSELDLPLGADARNKKNSVKKPKAQRNPSFKAIPNVFKKVVSGAKEIIQDNVDPARAVANQPTSIESWLNDTVDPFRENPSKKEPTGRESTQEDRKRSPSGPQKGEPVQYPSLQPLETQGSTQNRSPSEPRKREPVQYPSLQPTESQGSSDSQLHDSDASTKKGKTPTTPTSGLKRSRATRSASSPLKSAGRKPFREVLKEAFRGESIGHKLPPTIYPSCEADTEVETDPEEDGWAHEAPKRRSPDSSYRSPSPDPSSTVESSQSSASIEPNHRRRPPTKGVHALSTIISEVSSRSADSDTLSTVSQSTVTQATAFTKSTDISRQKSAKPGLKRRLTKHSDLVSVLSLPDNGAGLIPPSRSRSIKSSHSLHRRPSKQDKGRVDDLLDEFDDDEHFYQRELKTLVDGVVPVLLTQVIHGGDADRAAKLFIPSDSGDKKADALAKSVVNMGVALEKLRNYHRRVPLSDIRHLFAWLEAVLPVYNSYLDAWRLGFEDLIVNLAPVSGRLDDADSLLDALPRNEEGDVLGENGETVDVAYLLKRPLIRIKWMTKFLKAAVLVVGTHEVEDLLSQYEALQEKSRKRHREETARMTDEDANNTDTTRARDLRNLSPLDSVSIDQTRQVAAKDSFELDLDHSSGQRLECQVELVFRDKLDDSSDKGDVLIREFGTSSRSWLLFPPVSKEAISARKGDNGLSLVVMVRGTHNRREWFELIELCTSNEEQIADWLDILGSDPYPPTARSKAIAGRNTASPVSENVEIPVGERRLQKRPPASPGPEKPKFKTPSRYHGRQASAPALVPSPSSPRSPSLPLEQTPTRDSFPESAQEVCSLPETLPATPTRDQSPPSRNSNRRDSAKSPPSSQTYREDGAPPPPIHRSITPKSPSHLASPVDLAPTPRIKRRNSSPLKHEYHPSDVSSDSSSPSSDDSETSSSSSDELDEDDVPDTIPGYSIKEPNSYAPALSVISESSITPSHSASQVGHIGRAEVPVHKFVASVSYWVSKKGIWKVIGTGATSVVVHPGCVEVHDPNEHQSKHQAYPLQSSGTSEVNNQNKDAGGIVPLVSLILTPNVLIRRSNALDLEIKSQASQGSRLKIDSGTYLFRAASQNDAKDLYEAVHQSKWNNARYIQVNEEARVRSFGQQTHESGGGGSGDGDSSGQRRSWFGRKNSYRASTRAPSISQASGSTTISANSFLNRILGGGNTSFDIDKSTVDKHSRPGSKAGGAGAGSLYTSSASSSGGGGSTPPRSLSISLSGSGSQSQSQSRWSIGLGKPFSPDQPLEIRCHLNVQNNRWSDKGDCILVIRRPPPGVRQELALYHGMEKRVIVTHATKKTGDRPLILLDAVLGSKCFSMIGTKGIMCSVWENLRDEDGNVGVAPRNGALSGKITKWCFQCKNVQQADWIMKMVTSEVPGLMMG
ncbi:hypothetical protein B0T17DRAFT_587122 [Bombardia bombarda]|uniref:Uncharacterized protein n=1 Tax=Bombardia bombarda TaxID=252184 RepID=A0AA40CEF0_9PEZI|nr:hypothetical protein B0T17DRAFT_587122 [Bombardia bombarda]